MFVSTFIWDPCYGNDQPIVKKRLLNASNCWLLAESFFTGGACMCNSESVTPRPHMLSAYLYIRIPYVYVRVIKDGEGDTVCLY